MMILFNYLSFIHFQTFINVKSLNYVISWLISHRLVTTHIFPSWKAHKRGGVNHKTWKELQMSAQGLGFHTITNKSLLTPGPVRGLPGYNPFLTATKSYIQITISWSSHFCELMRRPNKKDSKYSGQLVYNTKSEWSEFAFAIKNGSTRKL